MRIFSSKQPATPAAAHPVAVVAHPVKQTEGRPQSIDVRAENIKSAIAAGEIFEGDMRLRHGLKLDGTVKGRIDFGSEDGLFVLNQSGVVEGDIYGPRAIILGEVRGNIAITGKLIIMASARISGDVVYGSIQMVEGAQMAGRLIPIADFQNSTIRTETTAQNDSQPAPKEELAPVASVLHFTAGSNAAAASR